MDRYILDGQYGKYLEMVGIKVGEALKKACVPEDLFSHKQPVLDEAAYYRFMEAVGEQITDPGIPIKLASAENIESFSPPIFAAYCSKNAEVCLKRLQRYKRIIAPMRYDISINDAVTELTISASSDELIMPRFLAESEIIFIIHIIRSATKYNIIPMKVIMQEPVTDIEFTEFLGCTVTKGNCNFISFKSEDMHKPFISQNDVMWDFFEPELQKRLYEMERDDSFSAKVRSALTELLPGGNGAIDEVAAKLSVSRRTLQRKLKEENTTFQQQLNGVRKMLARHYIRNTEMNSNDIAFLLGYSEINSFFRAFSLWTGMSVSEYRKQSE